MKEENKLGNILKAFLYIIINKKNISVFIGIFLGLIIFLITQIPPEQFINFSMFSITILTIVVSLILFSMIISQSFHRMKIVYSMRI